jgi:NAD(P)-dependent dehydrogenase (short-subunit alcohol dehydrogenase family)
MASAELTGSTALITGATSGIGRATALAFAKRGARVVVSGRDPVRGNAVVSAIRAARGKADFIAANLGSACAVRALARLAAELGGGHVDILVNNAGVFPSSPAVNVKAPSILVGALAPVMAARGRGSIVNVLTMAADAGMAPSGTSKTALTRLTRAWAAEFDSGGVRVNAVSPGSARAGGTPDEVAAAITYLTGGAADGVQGAVLDIGGAALNTDDAALTAGDTVLTPDGGRSAA